jgi:hypothetical protein
VGVGVADDVGAGDKPVGGGPQPGPLGGVLLATSFCPSAIQRAGRGHSDWISRSGSVGRGHADVVCAQDVGRSNAASSLGGDVSSTSDAFAGAAGAGTSGATSSARPLERDAEKRKLSERIGTDELLMSYRP